MFKTFDGKVILVEIDEFSHRYYDRDEERLKELKKNRKNCYVLRINVDSYKERKVRYPPIFTKTYDTKEVTNEIVERVHVNHQELTRRWEQIKFHLRSYFDSSFKRRDFKLFF